MGKGRFSPSKGGVFFSLPQSLLIDFGGFYTLCIYLSFSDPMRPVESRMKDIESGLGTLAYTSSFWIPGWGWLTLW